MDNLVWPLLVVVFTAFVFLLPGTFLTVRNIQFLLYTSAALGMIALAESICLISGNFDLSVGSIAGFSAMFAGMFLAKWFPSTPGVVGIAIILGVGGFIGMLNGFSISYLGVNPFLQTLAFLIIVEGGILVISNTSQTALPALYTYVGGGTVADSVPFAIVLMVIVFAFFGVALKYSRFGTKVYAVGGIPDAAESAGVNTKRVILFVYIISGMLSALGGLLYTGFLGAATPTLGRNALFPAFAAAVIGGISLFGGRGKITGAIGGVILLGTVEAGLVQLRVDPNVIRTTTGLVLLGAILLYTFIEKYRSQLLAN
jgi:ribose/xylose/arabinose/galactoside ABC-type transport system permease subunit